MSTARSEGLERFLQDAAQPDGEYAVERLLKESESEVTELVRDAGGTLWVRKLFCRDDPSIAASYRAIQDAASPVLPRIRDVHRSPAGTVVVREYLPGPTLRDWVGEYGPLDDGEARHVLLEVCEGVEALHSLDPPLIHRDVNPGNVIVTASGARLIDFGIARAYDEGASRDTHAWGTTGYAAPEQFGFDQSDGRTDVFGLGMLYWFLLTGKDPQANLSAQLRQDGGHAGDGAGIPEQARAIIRRCVALSPEDRYPDVGALADALRGGGEDSSPDTAEHGPRAPRHVVRKALRTAWTVVATSFMAFIALGVVLTLCEPWRLSVPEGWLHALAFCLGMLVMFAPAWLLSTDLFHVRERLPFLRRHTLARCIAIALACFVVGVFIANAATADLPAAYVQLMQEHGATSI